MSAPSAKPPVITVFNNRGWLLTIYFLFGCAIILQGLATAGYFLFIDDASEGFFFVIMGLAVVLVLAGIWFASQALRRLRDPEPPITVSPAGLHDRALSLRPIPWKDIRDIHVHHGGRGGPVVAFELPDTLLDTVEMRPRVRQGAHVNRAFGFGYRVHHMGTTASVDRLVEAMAPYIDVRRS